MATITLATLANGTTIDVTDVNANFAAIKAAIETTKLNLTNLTNTQSDCMISFTHSGALGSAAVARYRFKVPAGVTLYPKSVQLTMDTHTGAGACQLDIKNPSSTVLSAVCTASADDTLDQKTGFVASSYAAATEFVFELTETSGTGTVTGVSMVFWFATNHRTA